MADTLPDDLLADVIELFINESLFIGGSKKGQFAYAPDTKRFLGHNISDDTIVFGVSDDSLQMLKARAETIAGAKTFSAATVFNGFATFGNKINFGTNFLGNTGNGVRFDASDNFSIATNIVRDDNTGVLQLFAGKGLSTDAKLRIFGPSHSTGPHSFDFHQNGLIKFDFTTDGEILFWAETNFNEAFQVKTRAGALYFLVDTRAAVENLQFGNPSTNPTYTFNGSGLLTAKGDVLIDSTKKLFLNNITEKGSIEHDGTDLIISNDKSDFGNLILNTVTDNIIIRPAGTVVTTIDNSGYLMSTNKRIITAASAALNSGFRLPHGAAPTDPDNIVDGDVWTTTAGLFVRINGVTKTVTLT